MTSTVDEFPGPVPVGPGTAAGSRRPAAPAVAAPPPLAAATAPTDGPLIPYFVCAHAHIEPRDYLAERNRCSDCGLVLIR